MLGFLLYIDINFYYFIYFLATSNRALLKKWHILMFLLCGFPKLRLKGANFKILTRQMHNSEFAVG